jgi:hypothetical protein
MGFDPSRIPIVREAFAARRYPLVHFAPEDIVVYVDKMGVECSELFAAYGRRFLPPQGWRGYCERADSEALKCSA